MLAEVDISEYINLVNVAYKLGNLDALTEAIYEALSEYERTLADPDNPVSPSILKQSISGDWASRYLQRAISRDRVTIDKHRSNLRAPTGNGSTDRA